MPSLPPKSKSVVRTAQSARTADAKARQKVAGQKAITKKANDSFVNFSQNFGIGTDNALSGASYGFNPVTRNRSLLEWIHRGSWLGGIAVDVIADDMTRAGMEISGKMPPEDISEIEEAFVELGIWNCLNDTIKWARLYGGAVAVLLIDGQDMATPLRLNTIRKNQFKGLLPLDRWMVEPSMEDLITELGPNLGNPKFYTVTAQAPAMARRKIHYSRVVRLEGIRLPYWQRLMENMWGLSILERLYDRMVAFDSASTGAAQLVYKSYLRTVKIKGMREIIAAGGEAQAGLIKYVDMMRRFQGIEGITLLDGEDEYTAESHSAFSGLSDALQQFGQQISGALQIPLVRMFGQSPAGFSTGDTDIRNYYDTVNQKQEQELRVPLTTITRCVAASKGIEIPDGTKIKFKSLWQLSDTDKANVAMSVGSAVGSAEQSGLIDRATALRELKQSSMVTGVFSNITDEMIDEAEAEGPPLPGGEVDDPEGGEEETPEGGKPAAISKGPTASKQKQMPEENGLS